MTPNVGSGTRNTILTLSAVPDDDPLADRRPARPRNAALRGSCGPVAHIKAELRRIERARRAGTEDTAAVERLIDYIWFGS